MVTLNLSSFQALQRALQRGGFLSRVDCASERETETAQRTRTPGNGSDRGGGWSRRERGRTMSESERGRGFEAVPSRGTERYEMEYDASQLWTVFRLSRSVTALRLQRWARVRAGGVVGR